MASAEREPMWGFGGWAPSGVQGQSPWSGGRGLRPLKLAISCILTSMISVQIYCMKSTIKLQLAATAKLKIAFVELHVYVWNSTAVVHLHHTSATTIYIPWSGCQGRSWPYFVFQLVWFKLKFIAWNGQSNSFANHPTGGGGELCDCPIPGYATVKNVSDDVSMLIVAETLRNINTNTACLLGTFACITTHWLRTAAVNIRPRVGYFKVRTNRRRQAFDHRIYTPVALTMSRFSKIVSLKFNWATHVTHNSTV
jgi:hypothetical protein